MSRDWTPCELYLVDRHLTETEGRRLRDTEITIHFDGKEFPYGYPEAKAKYPELTFLFGKFGSLYDEYKDNKKANALFEQMEIALVDAEKKLLEHTSVAPKDFGSYDTEDLLQKSVGDIVEEWFYGRLDVSFYYSEVNDKAFLDYIRAKVQEIQKARKEKQTERE